MLSPVQEDDVADNPEPDGTTEDDTGLAGTVPADVEDGPATRRLRRKPNFRGQIVIKSDEPLPSFDSPAEPPPPAPEPDGKPSQSQPQS
jgi:hypothetical protein